jgi:ATP-dependent protease ClpP protease subunit
MSSRNDLLYNWMEYGIHYKNRIIRIDDEIDEVSASYAISGIVALDDTPGPITVQLSTYGGEWWPGMAIYDAIKGCNNHVTIIGSGYVMSMGTIIMQAADERLATPNTEFLIHVGSELFSGHYHDFQRYAEVAKRYELLMEDIYLEQIKRKNPRYPRTALRRLLAHDTYMTAHEAAELGIIDGVKE